MNDTPEKVTRETICDTEWLSLRQVIAPEQGVDGYVYSHETRCRGCIMAILPFRDTRDGRQYLVRKEVTPCWSMEPVLSAITGGWEGGDIADDAVRELREEAGYTVCHGDLIRLGTSYASKSSDTIYRLYGVDLTGKEACTPTGDGSRLEAEGSAVWLSADELADVRDPQVALMYVRIQQQTRSARSRKRGLLGDLLDVAGDAIDAVTSR